MARKLFKVKTVKSVVFYVISNEWTNAAEIVKKKLDDIDYGFKDDRQITSVECICEEYISGLDGKQHFYGDHGESNLIIDSSAIIL